MLYPFTRAIRYLNVRIAIINRFPYAIHFIIKEEDNLVYSTNCAFNF